MKLIFDNSNKTEWMWDRLDEGPPSKSNVQIKVPLELVGWALDAFVEQIAKGVKKWIRK